MLKRWKKICAVLTLCLTLLSGGCTAENAAESTEASAQEDDVPHLVIVDFAAQTDAETWSEVSERINAITREELGVEVEFVNPSSQDYSDSVELMLSSGAQVDILIGSNTLFMRAYINKWLCSLDGLLEEYGQDIIDAVGQDYIACCRIGGVLYGLPNNRDFAAGWDSYAFRKDILDKYDISVEDIKTVEDMEELFDLILEEEPGMVPLACNGTMFGNFALADGINSFPAGGHTNYGQDEEVVNIFETDEYMQMLKRVRRWYLKGYLGEDILENTSSTYEMIANGEAFAMAVKNKPGMKTQETLRCGTELEIVQFGETAVSYNSMAAYPWMITKNTISKELSMQVLNLFYRSPEIMNLLSYGIEGKDYVKTADGHITLPEGKTTNAYSSYAWTVPNQFITYVWEGNSLDLWDEMREHNKNALQSCEIGFNFNVFPVAKQYLALEEIYDAYKPILESGLVNPEQGLSQMLDELKQNGLDDVIEEKRQQFESWRKNQDE